MNDIELYRRIDWRFLLPGPLPPRVGYLGAPGPLLSALGKVTEVSPIRPASDGDLRSADNAKFELVVASSTAADLRQAAQAVAQGGMLYWEIRRGKALGRAVQAAASVGRRQFSIRPARLLRELGFSDVQLFWHRPDFENCREIVPMDGRDALLHFLRRTCSGLRRNVILHGARYLADTGVFPNLVTCLAVLAVRARKGPWR